MAVRDTLLPRRQRGSAWRPPGTALLALPLDARALTACCCVRPPDVRR